MSESRLNVPSLRNLLHDAGFRGSVRALNALGPIENADILCAYLSCSRQAPYEVFINTNVDCDHHHLTKDVMDLVHAFEEGQLDHGWNRKPNGDASTGITTRTGAARAGIPPSRWASNPYRNSG